MLAEEGDGLGSIEVPADLGPEGLSSSKREAKESKPEPKAEAKEEEPAAPEPKKEEKKATSPPTGSAGSTKGEGAEQEKAGGGHKELRHPQPLFPSVARLSVPCILLRRGEAKNPPLQITGITPLDRTDYETERDGEAWDAHEGRRPARSGADQQCVRFCREDLVGYHGSEREAD